MPDRAKEESPEISRLSNLKQVMDNLAQAVDDLEQDAISLGLQNQAPGTLEPPETSSISVKRFWLICLG